MEKENNQLLIEAAQTRKSFIEWVNAQIWDTQMRVKCEDIIIIYDQMYEALKEQNDSKRGQKNILNKAKDWLTEDWDK